MFNWKYGVVDHTMLFPLKLRIVIIFNITQSIRYFSRIYDAWYRTVQYNVKIMGFPSMYTCVYLEYCVKWCTAMFFLWKEFTTDVGLWYACVQYKISTGMPIYYPIPTVCTLVFFLWAFVQHIVAYNSWQWLFIAKHSHFFIPRSCSACLLKYLASC